MLEILQKGFETEPAGDAGFDFGELFGGEFFPARPDGGLVAEAVEEELISGSEKPISPAKRMRRTRSRASGG
jgi:hypothetical protein